MKAKLTDALCNQQSYNGQERTIADTDCQGLYLRIRNQKTFCLRYTNKHSKIKKMTLGRFPELSVNNARRKAYELREEIAQGTDPLIENKGYKSNLTLADLEHWTKYTSDEIHKSTPQKTIGRIREILKTEMEKRGMGATSLSNLSGVDHSIINKFLDPKLTEGNYRDLRVSTLSKFCKTIPQLRQVFTEMFDETEKKIEVMNQFKVSLAKYTRRTERGIENEKN